MIAIFYAISIAGLTIYGSNLLWMAICYARRDTLRPGRVPEPEDLPPPPEAWPDVTIQLPLYNEPTVAERLIDACAELEYPRSRLEIQVLDDSTDITSDRVAARIAHWKRRGRDIEHIRRDHREDYKAGALQNGLRLSRGRFIAIFDADFLPTRDFLLRTIPMFDEPHIGVVQTRWGHLNRDASLLTRVQAIGLDAHFAVEQRVRSDEGCYLNFNGTAGVWRRTCIEDAGGWHGDTIAEDFDLSYRAQMRGWRVLFLGDVEVPAELPLTMSALRSQQFRWAKGSVEGARKLLRPLLASNAGWRVKLQGAIHLTAHFVFPFILLASLLHAPLLVLSHYGSGPGAAYFGLMSFGLVGLTGFMLVQLFAQRDLYPRWGRALLFFPAFMAGTIGLSLHNSRAVMEAVIGKRSPFVRTPKFNVSESRGHAAGAGSNRFAPPDGPAVGSGSTSHTAIMSGSRPAPRIAWLELVLFLYSTIGLAFLLFIGEWAAAPFQAIFAGGFGLVTFATFRSQVI
jgi:cellulose synthase/poly-beta-1,6-N-acetylglucosamine synthase-like glycosyltransferase